MCYLFLTNINTTCGDLGNFWTGYWKSKLDIAIFLFRTVIH